MSKHGYSTPRPGSSSRAGQQPYPTAGSSRAGARAGGAGQNTPSYLTPRAIERNKWSQRWGTAAYLDQGPSNRLVLSLRSYIPAEIDFALDRLLQVSGQDPDLLRLSEFPGLLEGLIDLVREFLDARAEDRKSDTRGLWVDQGREAMRRRACEAALVLRNLAPEKHSQSQVTKNKKLRPLIVDVLAEGALEDGNDSNELRLYLLEVLDIIAEDTPLALPGIPWHAKPAPNASIGRSITFPLDSPAVRLLPLLVALTRSPDRALVMAAFRCLTTLSLSDTNDAALALLSYQTVDPLPKPHPHPIQTAIELLPIADHDLGAVILDYIYQHTLFPANAVLFCSRPDLLQVLRLVCTKLHIGARKDRLNVLLPMPGGDADVWFRSLPPKHLGNLALHQQRELHPQLEGDEVLRIAALAEPARTLAWMHTVFESVPNADITQVALWAAYRGQFEPLVQAKATAPLLSASEVIKLTTDAYPNALPAAIGVPEKKFVIQGMRIRDRTDMRTVYICRWTGCSAPLGAASPSSLYWHLHHTHLSTTPPATKCQWSSCTYVSPHHPLASPSLLLADLTLHTRVHLPSYHPPKGYDTSPYQPLDAQGGLQRPPTVLQHERYHTQMDEQGDVTGMGFLACLVLRNVARTVKIALGNPAGGASVNSLAEGGRSIFEALAEAEEGGSEQKEGGIVGRLEKIDFVQAKHEGADALMGLEERLLRTTVEDHGLGKMLGEVLEVVSACRASATRDTEKSAREVEEAEVGRKMEL